MQYCIVICATHLGQFHCAKTRDRWFETAPPVSVFPTRPHWEPLPGELGSRCIGYLVSSSMHMACPSLQASDWTAATGLLRLDPQPIDNKEWWCVYDRDWRLGGQCHHQWQPVASTPARFTLALGGRVQVKLSPSAGQALPGLCDGEYIVQPCEYL